MPAQAKFDRDVRSNNDRTDTYKMLIAFLVMMAPAAAFIFLAL